MSFQSHNRLSRSALILYGLLLLAMPPRGHAGRVETLDYDITWIGVSVGTMTVRSESRDDGSQWRSIRIWNRPWMARIYPVDNRIDCLTEPSPDGPRHTVTKQMGEKNFFQDDTLTLWPEAGKAIWSNAVSNTVHTFEVPRGAQDFVSFFFDLRDAAGADAWDSEGDYALVMDDSLEHLKIQVGTPRIIRTPYGRLSATPVKAVSTSKTLFSRNKPRAVWVSPNPPAVMFADVDTRFGTVRGTLTTWEIDGHPVAWESSRPTAN